MVEPTILSNINHVMKYWGLWRGGRNTRMDDLKLQCQLGGADIEQVANFISYRVEYIHHVGTIHWMPVMQGKKEMAAYIRTYGSTSSKAL